MKHQFLSLVILFTSFLAVSQEQRIQTESVSIENLIPFIINHIESDNLETTSNHITFLIQTSSPEFIGEEKFILKQAFKLIANRLSQDDYISIIAYSNVNGIVLEKTQASNLKLILHRIENLKSNIKTHYRDGMELAYNYAKTNFVSEANNTVVIIRNPDTSNVINSNRKQNQVLQDGKESKSNTVLLTAITLLPQIISVIKD